MATTHPGAAPDTNTPRLLSLVATKRRPGLTLGKSGVVLALHLGACTGDASTTATGGEVTEGAESDAEGTEGGSGGGDVGESHGGSEGAGLGQAAEGGGTATVSNTGDTFDQARYTVRDGRLPR